MLRLVPVPWLVLGVVLLVAGSVISIAGDGKADAIGFGIGGAGAILLVGLAFYAVGRSEEIDREQRPMG